MSEQIHTVHAEELGQFCAALFMTEGVPEDEARITADVLVEANLAGMDSHGVSRVAAYMERLRQGGNRRVARVDVLADFPAGATWDANGSLGQGVAYRAMRAAMDKARNVGVGFVAIRRNNHTGANAYYVRMAAEEGLIGLAAGNGPPMMAPWGSASPFFSTNPLSFGVPAGEERPIIIDMATSVSARGKIILAAKNGMEIPLGWAVDEQGNDTQAPEAALKGVLLPFGGHKGYAVAVMVEVLAGLLSGAGYGPTMNEHYRRHDVPVNSGNLFAAVDVSRFVPLGEFRRGVDGMIQGIHSGRVRPGFEEILLPGEREARTREERLRGGIPLSGAVCRELKEEGRRCGVTAPAF